MVQDLLLVPAELQVLQVGVLVEECRDELARVALVAPVEHVLLVVQVDQVVRVAVEPVAELVDGRLVHAQVHGLEVVLVGAQDQQEVPDALGHHDGGDVVEHLLLEDREGLLVHLGPHEALQREEQIVALLLDQRGCALLQVHDGQLQQRVVVQLLHLRVQRVECVAVEHHLVAVVVLRDLQQHLQRVVVLLPLQAGELLLDLLPGGPERGLLLSAQRQQLLSEGGRVRGGVPPGHQPHDLRQGLLGAHECQELVELLVRGVHGGDRSRVRGQDLLQLLAVVVAQKGREQPPHQGVAAQQGRHQPELLGAQLREGAAQVGEQRLEHLAEEEALGVCVESLGDALHAAEDRLEHPHLPASPECGLRGLGDLLVVLGGAALQPVDQFFKDDVLLAGRAADLVQQLETPLSRHQLPDLRGSRQGLLLLGVQEQRHPAAGVLAQLPRLCGALLGAPQQPRLRHVAEGVTV